jgi:hypothetical protein
VGSGGAGWVDFGRVIVDHVVVSDVPLSVEESLRAVNAWLRQVVEAQDTEIVVLREQVSAERAARELLERRLAELERRLV